MDSILGPTKVLVQNLCHFGSPEILTVALKLFGLLYPQKKCSTTERCSTAQSTETTRVVLILPSVGGCSPSFTSFCRLWDQCLHSPNMFAIGRPVRSEGVLGGFFSEAERGGGVAMQK